MFFQLWTRALVVEKEADILVNLIVKETSVYPQT